MGLWNSSHLKLSGVYFVAFFLGVDGMANDMYLFSVGVDEEDLVSLLEQLFEQNTINLMEGLSTPRVSQMMLTGID